MNAEEVLWLLHHGFLDLWRIWPLGDFKTWQKSILTYYKGTGNGQEYVS